MIFTNMLFFGILLVWLSALFVAPPAVSQCESFDDLLENIYFIVYDVSSHGFMKRSKYGSRHLKCMGFKFC